MKRKILACILMALFMLFITSPAYAVETLSETEHDYV